MYPANHPLSIPVKKLALIPFVLSLAVSGCVDPPAARYVYQDGEYGVIGIPRNSFLGRVDYRAQAEMLMDRHFPEGYEIVRAEEVNEGQRVVDLGKKTEIDAEPGLTGPREGIKLGKLNRMTSFEEKDQLQLRECRIIYKKKAGNRSERQTEFTALASLTPAFYVDPNEAMRHGSAIASLPKVDPVLKLASLPEVKKLLSQFLK